jgi:hypothetical protein
MTDKNKGKHKELSEPFPSVMMHNDAGCWHPVATALTARICSKSSVFVSEVEMYYLLRKLSTHVSVFGAN